MWHFNFQFIVSEYHLTLSQWQKSVHLQEQEVSNALSVLKSAKNLWLPSSQNTPTLNVPKIQKYQNSCISLYIPQEFRMIVRTNESMFKEVIQFITTTKYFDINMVKRVVISKKIWDSFVRNHLAPYYIKLNGKAAY